MLVHIPVRRIVFAAAGFLCTLALYAATYLAGSDADLARRAPVIVRASVVSQQARLENVDGRLRPFTIVSLVTLETIKGRVPEAFSLRLPGGKVGDTVAWVPGTPSFPGGAEVVLFLERAAGGSGTYRLAEFGLSKFDLVEDEDGHRYAVRSVFTPRDDLRAADRGDVLARLAEKASVPARDAESFLAALRALAAGREPGEIVWRQRSAKGDAARRPKWVNIGGREPGDCGGGDPCLFRWYWANAASPDGVIQVTGTQTNLTNDDAMGCGADSVCDVQHAVDEWTSIAGTEVAYSGPAAAGNVRVVLDALQDFNGGSAWVTALGCGGGVIGLGGPADATGPRTYRGDDNYYAAQSGDVSMRKITCGTGYSARTFKTAVMHELGHTLGLGHPDEDVSAHSVTSSNDWNEAVMHSVVPATKPDLPESDDVQAIQYLYTTGPLGVPPTADFTFAPTSPVSGAPVQFSDSSAGAPTGWAWNFGDSASGTNTSIVRNPSHTFSSPGTYTVTLLAASTTGTGATTKTITVGQGTTGCTPSATTLCLNNDRFAVAVAYRTNDGRSGNGTGTELTADSGYFYFFDAANIEVVVKVLNACPIPGGSYWVFAAGLTNVEVTLRVTDTQTGSVKTYFSPLGTAFAPVQDTSAFSTCP